MYDGLMDYVFISSCVPTMASVFLRRRVIMSLKTGIMYLKG